MSLVDLHNLYDFWFNNPNIWFNSQKDDDIIITYFYEQLMNDIINIDINVDVDTSTINTDRDTIKLIISIILLHDQVPRHIQRIRPYKYDDNFIKDLNIRIIS